MATRSSNIHPHPKMMVAHDLFYHRPSICCGTVFQCFNVAASVATTAAAPAAAAAYFLWQSNATNPLAHGVAPAASVLLLLYAHFPNSSRYPPQDDDVCAVGKRKLDCNDEYCRIFAGRCHPSFSCRHKLFDRHSPIDCWTLTRLGPLLFLSPPVGWIRALCETHPPDRYHQSCRHRGGVGTRYYCGFSFSKRTLPCCVCCKGLNRGSKRPGKAGCSVSVNNFSNELNHKHPAVLTRQEPVLRGQSVGSCFAANKSIPSISLRHEEEHLSGWWRWWWWWWSWVRCKEQRAL